MHLITKPESTVLLTTPDYPPQIGGLSTFTLNIERSLKSLNIPYDILVWDSVGELKKKKDSLKSYQHALHIHFMGGHFLPFKAQKNINFVHGSEILFYSPNILKRLVKRALKKKMIHYFSESHSNIFISEVTERHLLKLGLKKNYARDFVFHNCSYWEQTEQVVPKVSDQELHFICVARDVPHKNIQGALELCKSAFKILQKKITLYVTAPLSSQAGVDVVDISGISNEDLASLYRQCHFNVLLSLDHAHRGFFEGFGLTVLEAGHLGVPSIVSSHGGLPEAVHHQKTGWVLDHVVGEKGKECFDHLWHDFSMEQYETVSRYVYEHTQSCHHIKRYDDLLRIILT